MMPIQDSQKAFASHVIDLMQIIGPVYDKRMFGGYGIFLDGLMFGLIADSTLYFKTDEKTVSSFSEKGLEAFSYLKKGKDCKLSYFQAPEEALEDIEEMREWANMAFNTALRAKQRKK